VKSTQILAASLALTGCIFLPLGALPILWPGLLIWIGWLAIALGLRWVSNLPFWFASTLWHGGLLTIFFLSGPPTQASALVIGHLCLSLIFSIVAISAKMGELYEIDNPRQTMHELIPLEYDRNLDAPSTD
jgi:hypothetical protein